MGATNRLYSRKIEIYQKKTIKWSLLNCVLYVLTCQRALRAYVPTCLACLRAQVPCVPKCSGAISSNNTNKISMKCFT